MAHTPPGQNPEKFYRHVRDRLLGGAAPTMREVQAERLQEAIDNPDGRVVSESTRRSDDLFTLRVRGDSMIGVGILPGDLVIVRRSPASESEAIVVAMVADEATVKTLRLRRGRVVLEPVNPAYAAITPSPAAVQVFGRNVEVRRQLT